MLLEDYLKEKRAGAKLSQKDVSNKLGYKTSQFISNWERGLSTPPITVIKKLAGIYNVPAKEMFDEVLKDTLTNVGKDLTEKFERIVL